MSRWRGLRWWLLLVPALPLLLPLALHTRRRALRLAPAAGPLQGVAGGQLPGKPLLLLVLGESTVAGVGVSCLSQALVGCLARALCERQGRPVVWRACGENGITVAEARKRLLPQVLDDSPELVLLVFGVNDSTALTSIRRWQRALGDMAETLAAGGARVVFTGVPPLQHFRALPWLLRTLLGVRAALLDAGLREVAGRIAADYCPLDLPFAAEYLALDGYHPSALGYRLWAEGVAGALSLAPAPAGPAG
ncbi:SGNH/GDSL hydrolase family protein [Pseudomonas benzenivorans]|uniref:SGNH/GDSL hydrolase family protein n=1 Tax=Pseudomonas benzenivorans TaxID=556533 RepID=A0ABZ0PSK6_9PSED|nr:SGNH/GDSL hydrolase family protein [Pseudomonas benzenivorans]WPC04143.1 SGNH/GDSL hydrolase family protein [Pseudomonas benzenivorans]